jgi:glycosyltransferase involved in cell wall biosynthesis
MNTELFLNNYKLFWQYPAKTEWAFYQQNKSNSNYIGLPWATFHDKRYNLEVIYRLVFPHIDETKYYYTCCQHIAYKKFIPLWKALNINIVFISHKQIGVDVIDDIKFFPCPLYAVNIETLEFNKTFNNINVENYEKTLLYSFIGGYQPRDYMNNIRQQIFNMKHPENTDIVNTGIWHLNDLVFSKAQNFSGDINKPIDFDYKTNYYNLMLLKSKFTLCPSGSGPNSIRFWEALAVGSIPILLSDTLELPYHELWDEAIIRIPEKDLEKIYDKICLIEKNMVTKMSKNCIKIYNDFKNNYVGTFNKQILHYCDGCYEMGNIGGVARYDYQIKLIYPQRIFIKGPQHKYNLITLLEIYKNNCIIITDNHLSCDIPNVYNIFLVHHGCAKTTALRNPDWPEPYRSLCVNGQNKMLKYRDPNTTKIISISSACSDDFINYYQEDYNKYTRIDIFHPSELDENIYKTTFNINPIVLGNWTHVKKGKNLIPSIKTNLKTFSFRQLKIPMTTDPTIHNKNKQKIYCESDIFLQISNSEGNSYASLDAMLCGLVIVASNVGLFYKDVPDDCFVKLEWEKNNDIKYVEEKLKYAWENRDKLSKNARNWYLNNYSFLEWKKQMYNII